MNEPSFEFAIVCEAPADREIACTLADRVLTEVVPWLDGNLDTMRRWRGESSSDEWLRVQSVPERTRARGIRVFGKFDGHDAHLARSALLLLLDSDRVPDAVVIVRDTDGDLERVEGWKGAIAQLATVRHWPCVLGVEHAKRECWALNGYEPRNDHESARVDEVRRELGFDPVRTSEQLDATHDTDKRSAKRVLGVLTSHERNREVECWTNTHLERLRENGRGSKLAEFLDAVGETLGTLLIGRT